MNSPPSTGDGQVDAVLATLSAPGTGGHDLDAEVSELSRVHDALRARLDATAP